MPAANESAPATSGKLKAIAWIALPTLLITAASIGLMYWPVTATVDIETSARRVYFRITGENAQLLDKTSVQSTVLRGFDQIRIPASAVQIADAGKYDLKHGLYPATAWRTLPVHGSLTLYPTEGGAARIEIQPDLKGAGGLTLDRIFSGPAEVAVELPEKDYLTIDLRGARQRGVISLPKQIQITSTNARAEAFSWPTNETSVTLRIEVPDQNPLAEFSAATGMFVGFAFAPGETPASIVKDLEIHQVEFLEQGPVGQVNSTLSGPGKITFSDYSGIPDVPLDKDEYLEVQNLAGFYLRQMGVAKEEQTLDVKLHGRAGTLQSGHAGAIADRRPKWFDILWKNPNLTALFTGIVWLVTTFVAIRKFYGELHQ